MSERECQNKDFIPDCVRTIVKTRNHEFRTCEILTRIDNLMSCDEQKLLEYTDKIRMLKSLRKALEPELKEGYLISRKQHNSARNVFELIDRKIDEYTVLQYNAVPISKIYDLKHRRI